MNGGLSVCRGSKRFVILDRRLFLNFCLYIKARRGANARRSEIWIEIARLLPTSSSLQELLPSPKSGCHKTTEHGD